MWPELGEDAIDAELLETGIERAIESRHFDRGDQNAHVSRIGT